MTRKAQIQKFSLVNNLFKPTKLTGAAGLIFILLLLLVLIDLEVAELVALLGVGDDAQPVTKIVLLQVLFGQILQVPAGTNKPESTSPQVDVGTGSVDRDVQQHTFVFKSISLMVSRNVNKKLQLFCRSS